MSITNYSELQVTIADWLNRSDLTAVIPDFIELVDARLNRLQLTREVKELFLDDGTGDLGFNAFVPASGPVPVAPIPLTESMTNLRSLVLFGVEDADAPGTFNPPIRAPVVKLVSLEQIYASRSFNTRARQPLEAAVLPDRIVLSPLPDAVYRWQITVEVHEPLSDANTTNTVLTTAPDVYLYGALTEAAPYLKDDPRAPVWEQRFLQGVVELEQLRDRTEWPNTPIAPQPRVFT